MKTFSVSRAIAEPFRQAGRRPVVTLVWGLAMLAPTAIILAAMIPMLTRLAASGALDAGPGAEVSPWDDHFAEMIRFHVWSQLANLAQMFGLLLVTTAMIRAVFAGRGRDRTGFLRIGMHELYVAVVGVTIGIGMVIAMVVAVLLAVAVGLALGDTPDPWRMLIYAGMGVALAVGFLALWGRLALLAPASLLYDTFAFVEGWRLGRGQTGRLLALLILMALIMIVIGVALVGTIAMTAALAGGGLAAADPEAALAWLEGLPRRPLLLAGLVLVLLPPVAWIHGVVQLLATAPFARAALDLAPEPDSANFADTSSMAD